MSGQELMSIPCMLGADTALFTFFLLTRRATLGLDDRM